ncbi:neogenin-like isoform X3 [Dreissena polymorpha]|uniref:neogenin-like isoform X3 n=1 Tax=Dreissena polymorpha TaxID=45954 RepID=UPI002263C875|nr:neogenin-like isoform X3 [Dreissena polymorpha]
MGFTQKKKNECKECFVMKSGYVLIGLMCLLLPVCEGNGSATFTNFYFAKEPTDVIGFKGGSLRLPCSVIHANRGAPIINWYKDGQLLVTGSRVSIEKDGNLLISDIVDRKSDAGSYHCSATWEGQIILSRKCKVLIAGMERGFLVEPTNVEVYLTDTAMFQCAIDSVPSANITWYKDDALVTDRTGKFRTYPEGVLEVSDVQFGDFGTYSCQAEGVDRPRRSQAVKLLQKKAVVGDTFEGFAPNFTLKPRDTSAMVGSKVILFCGAYGLGSDMTKPKITWLKNERTIDLNKDGRVTMIGGGNLQILDVKFSMKEGEESDDATYMCRAENDLDSNDAEAKLDVLVPPVFTVTPQDQLAHEKQDIQILCQASGHPRPRVSWYRNGHRISSENEDYIKIVDENSLRILGLMMQDSGYYQCFAENSIGSIQATMQLKVIQTNSGLSNNPSNPSIIYHVYRSGAMSATNPEDIPSPPTTLAAAIVATRYVTLTWEPPTKKGANVEYMVRWQETGSDRERVANTSQTEMNVLFLKPNAEYTFWVSAFNQYGVTQVPATVKVKTLEEEDVPTEPINVSALPLTPKSIKVTWGEPLQTKGRLLNYAIYYYVDGDTEEEQTSIDTTKREHLFTDLQEYQEYTFRVIANNTNGIGVSSPEVTARTFSDAPSDAPQNFTIETASSTSLVVRWQAPKEEHQNGKITGYKIRYKKKGAKQGSTVTTAGDRILYALTDLKKDTQYQVRISAQTVNGSGPPTDWLTGKTYADDLDETAVPEIPDRLVVRPGPNSLLVQWVPNRRSKYLVRGYYLGYGKGIADVYRQVFDASTFDYTIENLHPASEYVVSIRGYNNVGEGPPRYDTVFTLEETAEELVTPMLPPIGLKAMVLSYDSVVLTWTDNSLGKIQRITDNRFYTIRYTTMPSRGRYRYENSTELVKHINDLRPDTTYEFSIKVTKGRRRSTWSMAVTNKTNENSPGTMPRDLTPVPVEGNPLSVTLNWQPPQRPNGLITEDDPIESYLVFYTTDNTKDDRDWVVEGVLGEKLSMTITDLTPDTTYYFKVQARNSKGYGPMSQTRFYKTPKAIVDIRKTVPGGGPGLGPSEVTNEGTSADGGDDKKGGVGGLSQNVMIIIIACVVGATFCIVVAVITVFLCRRREPADRNRMTSLYKGSPQKSKSPKPSGPSIEGQPPDLWINHDKLSKDDRVESSISVASTRRNSLSSVHTNIPADIYTQSGSEAEERLLPPSYNQLPNSQQRNIIRPKPLKLSVDAQTHIREPVATVSAYPNGNIMARYTSGTNRPPSPDEDSGVIPMRPVYPRTQYQMQYAAQGPPRVNAGDFSNTSYRLVPCMEDDDHCHPEAYDDSQMHRVGYGGFSTPSHHGSLTRRHKTRTPITGIASPVKHMSSNDVSNSETHHCQQFHMAMVHSNSGTLGRTRSPFRSFSVDGPTGGKSSTPKHIVKPQQMATPFKKVHTAPPIVSGPIKPRAMMAPIVSPKSSPDVLKSGHDEKDITKVGHKSLSTEELTAEMANLEGLMKDLNAITQQDFEC